jgi:Concanavalin A-like lectin/glucanases superfamily
MHEEPVVRDRSRRTLLIVPWLQGAICPSLVIAMAGFACVAQAVVTPIPQYLATYDFEGTLNDGTGNGFNLAAVPPTIIPVYVPGHSGQTLSPMNGTYYWATGPLPASFPPPAFTMDAWVNSSDFTTTSDVIEIVNAAGAMVASLHVQGRPQVVPGGSITFKVSTAAGSCSALLAGEGAAQPTNLPQKNQWLHLAGIYDGVSARAFLNGLQVVSVPCALGPLAAVGNKIQIGSGSFSGSIDEVRFSSGRNAPETCPASMKDSLNGFCIDSASHAEGTYGDSLGQCAARFSQVCTFGQLYGAIKAGGLVAPPGSYRVEDVMFDHVAGRSILGGYIVPPPNTNDPLQLPNPTSVTNAPSPNPNALPYYCCRRFMR